MIYPSNFESKIGYDRIAAQIADLCTTVRGRELFAAEGFSTSGDEIAERLGLCHEVLSALRLESEFPREEFAEFGFAAAKLSVEGSFLEIEELIMLRNGLASAAAVVGFFAEREDYPMMLGMTEGVSCFPDIVNHINTIIDRFGKVKDSASAELYSLRRSIREREGRVSKRLQALLAEAIRDGYTDSDAQVSIRDGRAVIPVTAANKKRMQGLIHDTSSTGRTLYVEPVEIVEMNNEIKELEYAERREIVRILTEFTDSLRPEADEIDRANEFLARVDMIRAKARWADENGGVKPIVSDEGRLSLRSARHPLLQQTLAREGKQVVPLDMVLDRARRILVISGPNAGGKSVCLKTVGLLQYMFQCGIPVTLLENSEMPVFSGIFIDIGDEQSIDNDLSTYSSHLNNMKQMLANVKSDTLVLIDEFGSGTEPIMGGAIAEALLERFVEQGTFGVITTHYSNIKYFASAHEGVVNGAMQFDVQHIMPLFRLEMGTPGSSFAVEIARKIGLPESIITRASDMAGSEHVDLEKQLRDVARDKRYWEQKRERIRVTDRKVEEMEQQYADNLARIKQERQTIIKQAKEEAQKMLAEANRQIEQTIRTIKEAQAEKEMTSIVRKELADFKESVERSDELSSEEQARIEREMERVAQRQQRREQRKMRSGEKVAAESAETVVLPLEVGSKVRIEGQDGVGEVTAMKGKKVTVAFGQIITTIAAERLTVISSSEYKRQTRPVKARTVVSVDISSRKLNFHDSIDVRGMRAAEALEAVQNFVDDAIMVGVDQLTILHGKGTGALKEEIRRYLRSVREVESASDEHADRGGAGITIVKLS